MAAGDIECQVCGSRNERGTERCASCGARLTEIGRELTDEELYARRNQPDGFEWRWVFISFVVFLVMAALVLALLPVILPFYDPQGFPGVMITSALWFLGAVAINYISPGKTFLEPPVGGLLAAIPTMLFLSSVADVYKLSMGAYVLGVLMAAMMALMGGYLGESLGGGRTGRPGTEPRRPARPSRPPKRRQSARPG
jgi:DNA-directed RNA polymerase subunit RPC12/RpoP